MKNEQKYIQENLTKVPFRRKQSKNTLLKLTMAASLNLLCALLL